MFSWFKKKKYYKHEYRLRYASFICGSRTDEADPMCLTAVYRERVEWLVNKLGDEPKWTVTEISKEEYYEL